MNQKSNTAVRRKQARAGGEAEYDNRRKQVIEAAAKIFRQKGFHASSLADIGKESGIDRATIYYYFSGKEEIFQEIVLGVTKSNVAMIEEITASSSDTADKMHSLFINLMKSYEENYPYLYLYLQENTSQIAQSSKWSTEMAALTKNFQDLVVGLIETGVKEGTFVLPGTKDARLVANALIGMCNWSHKWFTPGRAWTAEEVGNVFSGIILKGIKQD